MTKFKPVIFLLQSVMLIKKDQFNRLRTLLHNRSYCKCKMFTVTLDSISVYFYSPLNVWREDVRRREMLQLPKYAKGSRFIENLTLAWSRSRVLFKWEWDAAWVMQMILREKLRENRSHESWSQEHKRRRRRDSSLEVLTIKQFH